MDKVKDYLNDQYDSCSINKELIKNEHPVMKACRLRDLSYESGGEYEYGMMYECGEGVPQSNESAIWYYLKAIMHGTDQHLAQKKFDMLFKERVCSEFFYKELFFEVARSAYRDIPGSCYCLGLMYEYGKGVQQSYNEAFEWYSKACDKKYPFAEYAIGLCYEYGRGVQQSICNALGWYYKAAKQGFVDSQRKLGLLFKDEKSICSYDKSFEYFKMAAQSNDAISQYNIGLLYENGMGVQQSYSTAFEWYQKAAEQGYSEAECKLGHCYCDGIGVEQSSEQALKWFYKASKSNNSDAEYNIGLLLLNDDNYECSSEIAIDWFKKAYDDGCVDALDHIYYCDISASIFFWHDLTKWYKKYAEKGEPWAQYRYGNCCEGQFFTIEGKKSEEEAIKWYEKASNQKYSQAEYIIVLKYMEGKGNPTSDQRIIDLLSDAAEQGHTSAMKLLADCYKNGWYLQQSDEMAFKWYSKTAINGDSFSQYCIGVMYEEGICVEQSYELAFKWYNESISTHTYDDYYDDALYRIGRLYEEGKGVEQSYEFAFQHYHIYYGLRSALCSNALGQLYLSGKGVEKSISKAIECFIEASNRKQRHSNSSVKKIWSCGKIISVIDKNYSKIHNNLQKGKGFAQFNLGLLYESGIGVKQSYAEAIKWYRLSADNGITGAVEKVTYLSKKLIEENAQNHNYFEKSIKEHEDVLNKIGYISLYDETPEESCPCTEFVNNNSINNDKEQTDEWIMLFNNLTNKEMEYIKQCSSKIVISNYEIEESINDKAVSIVGDSIVQEGHILDDYFDALQCVLASKYHIIIDRRCNS